jgi:hypothetical protein
MYQLNYINFIDFRNLQIEIRVVHRGLLCKNPMHPDPSFELSPRLRTRVQNSSQAIHAKIRKCLAIFIYLFLLFTKKNLLSFYAQ